MSNSTSLIDLVTATSAAKEAALNALFDAASPATLWGRYARTCAGLTWGYYGGTYVDNTGTAHTIANGTVTLTANATNYIYADLTTGAVSINTTGFPAGQVPLYSVVVPSGGITPSSYLDYRSYQPSATGGAVTGAANEGATGVGLFDAGASTPASLKFKSLLSGGNVALAAGSTAVTISAPGGTVTGGANEGSGVGVFDSTNSTATSLKSKTLVQGANMRITDYAAGGIAVDVAGGPPDVLVNGALGVVAAQTINFKGFGVTNPSGTIAQVSMSSGNGAVDAIPTLSGFTQSVQSGATASATQQAWGITASINANGLGGVGQLMFTKAVPGAPYQAATRMRATPMIAGTTAGMIFYDSVSGKLKGFVFFNNGGTKALYIMNFNSVTSWNSTPYNANTYQWPTWMRVRDDNTNWYYELSTDGVTWVSVYQEARNSFLTPNQVGAAFANANSFKMAIAIPSLYVGT